MHEGNFPMEHSARKDQDLLREIIAAFTGFEFTIPSSVKEKRPI